MQGSGEPESSVMVYSIEEVSPGVASMGKGGFQSGILMVRIPISDTRNYYGGMIKRGNRLGKTLACTEGNVGTGQPKQKW